MSASTASSLAIITYLYNNVASFFVSRDATNIILFSGYSFYVFFSMFTFVLYELHLELSLDIYKAKIQRA